MNTWSAGALIVGLTLASALTTVVKRTALRRNWVGQALPHHFHDGPVPRLGGISIFLTVLILTLASMLFRSGWASYSGQILAVFLAGTLVFGVGLWDDFSPIPPFLKALLEVFSGVILYLGHVRLESFPPLFSGPLSPLLSFCLTVTWVVGITNSFNLIDGLDGLATGSALISSATLAILFTLAGHAELALVSSILAGALLGFLKFNFSPAVIFLGDCGSLFIGFLMSTLGLVLLKSTSSPAGILIPMLAFGLPILDTILAIVRRVLKKQPIYMPDCEHMHHKLVASGLSAPTSAFALYTISAFFAVISVLLVTMPTHLMLLATLPLCCVGGCFVGFGYHKYVPEFQQLNRPVDLRADGDSDHRRESGKNARRRISPKKKSGSRTNVPELDEVLVGPHDNHRTGVAFSDD
jgi:UDP-GlcNAc:undecaprenyl-phosphate/decaprenyl-phosphate GlcNAc-1-phosphate transferase